MLPPVKGFLSSTLLDYEGKVAAVVFLPGCNFRCGYCHAAHLVASPNELEAIPPSAVLQALTRGRGWIDGVVISGGEPTLHAGLRELIESFRAHGLLVKLDTNGTRPEAVQGLLSDGLLDAVSMDVKAPFDSRYEAVTRRPCDLAAVRESVRLLTSSGVEYEFRTTVCPAFTAGRDIEDIGRAIRGARLYVLQNFRPVDCLDPSLESVKPYTPDELRQFARRASEFVETVKVRGDAASVISSRLSERSTK